MPWLAFFMVLFTFSSIGVPGLNGFAGEFLILIGAFQRGWADAPPMIAAQLVTIAVLAVSGVVLGAWYMLWLVQRVFFGPLKEPHLPGEHPAGALSLRPAVGGAGSLPAVPRSARWRAWHRPGGAAAAPARIGSRPGPGARLERWPPGPGRRSPARSPGSCPGAYAWIGTDGAERGPPLHNPAYDFNDKALSIGAAYWVAIITRMLCGR